MIHFFRWNLKFSINCQKKIHLFCLSCRLKSWNVMFFGSDDFSLTSLKGLYKCFENKTFNKLEVVSLTHHETPVTNYAQEKNLVLHVWPPPLTNHFDFGVVVSFGKLIPKNIINYFPLGILNVHPSLLPQYRGAMPIFHAMNNGDSITGVTIMKIKPFKFDVGDIILQKTCEIGKDELLPSLKTRLAEIGKACLLEVIENLPNAFNTAVAQSSQNASSAPKVSKDIAIINWRTKTSVELYNLYRALYGMYDLKTNWHNNPVKLLCISKDLPSDEYVKLTPGSVEYCQKNKVLRVHCVDKPLYVCSLRIKHKLMTASDFCRGYLNSKDKKDRRFSSSKITTSD